MGVELDEVDYSHPQTSSLIFLIILLMRKYSAHCWECCNWLASMIDSTVIGWVYGNHDRIIYIL